MMTSSLNQNKNVEKDLLRVIEQVLSLNVNLNFTKALILAADEKVLWELSNKELLVALKKFVAANAQDNSGIDWTDEQQLNDILNDDIYD